MKIGYFQVGVMLIGAIVSAYIGPPNFGAIEFATLYGFTTLILRD